MQQALRRCVASAAWVALLAEPPLLLVTGAELPLGVAPKDAKKYSKSKFRCLNGKGRKKPLSVINDNFCDCDDGSDEPGTGACAGTGFTMFYCANEGSVSRLLYASRVGDGLCDCCDGSDELALAEQRGTPFACTNFCAEDGKVEAAKLEKMAEVVRRGLRKKKRIVKEAKAGAKQLREERDRLESDVAELEERVEIEAKAALEAKRRAAVSKEVAKEQPAEAMSEKALLDSDADASNQQSDAAMPVKKEEKGIAESTAAEEGKPQVSEYVKWMEGYVSSPDEAAVGAKEEATVAAPNTKSAMEPTAAASAKEELEEKRRRIQHVDQKIRSLASLGKDFQAYSTLNGETLSIEKGEHTYKVGFFDRAVQQAKEPITLGYWAGFMGPRTAKYMGGEGCWMGPPRSLEVTFTCGEEVAMLDVAEPSKCFYKATVVHPGACDAADLERLKLETRVVGPHDEL